MTEAELKKEFGPCWVLNRRFCLRQGSKLRMIADMSEHLTNATVGYAEKLELGGVDETVVVRKDHPRSGLW
jgi:hypothetical protein